MKTVLTVCFFILFSLTPCRAEEAKPLHIVASFSILGDIIHQIGGEDIRLDVLVGADADAHEYQPTPDDVKKVAQADIIAINGLKFEGWMTRLIHASGSKAKLLVASAGVKPRLLKEEEGHHHHHHGHHKHERHGGEILADPHAWQDLRNGGIYAQNAAAAIIAARPDLKEKTEARLADYIEKLRALHKEMKEAFAEVPQEKRKIVTSHDAFGYFGEAYGVMFLAPVGISTEAEPSAADIGHLIEQIRAEGVKTVFAENMASPRLIEQLAKDAGASLGGTLYADALSKKDGEAPDYLAMMRLNAARMLQSMGGKL